MSSGRNKGDGCCVKENKSAQANNQGFETNPHKQTTKASRMRKQKTNKLVLVNPKRQRIKD